MRKSEKVKCFRLSLASLLPVFFREPAEFYQPRFAWLQLQPEECEPLFDCLKKSGGILLELEGCHEVISENNQSAFSLERLFEFHVIPECQSIRQTTLDVYCIALIGDYLEYAAQVFAKEQRKASVFDIVCLRDLYRKISAIIGGEEQLERLNLLIQLSGTRT